MGNLFSIESPVFQWLSKLADRMILNVLFVASCIPIFTIGAATAALYDVTGRIQREEAKIWGNYWRAFRSNFKQATLLWLILLVSGVLIGFSVLFYFQSGQSSGIIGILLVVFGVLPWAVTSAWVFPLQSRFENSVRNTLKNALLCGLLCFPKSLVATIINILPAIIFLLVPATFLYFTLLWLVVWFAVAASINMALFKKKFEELENMSEGNI